MNARDRGLRVRAPHEGLGRRTFCLGGDGWGARGGVRASRGSMESYNRSKESDMDSWERFTVSL